MPAIQVARTDTFEQQRQKINQIGEQIFNVTAGGSDLSTGNLKLGDGTRIDPSLAFVNEPQLGIYRPNIQTIGFVASSKKIFDIASSEITSYKDLKLQQSILTTSGVSISNPGKNYDVGNYSSVQLSGGTGSGALADINVVAFGGTITNTGKNYTSGSYPGISLSGGSGSGALCSFDVDGIVGTITNPGSGYAPGIFTSVPLFGGTGTGAIADITITGTSTISGSITNNGSGYQDGTYSGVLLTGGNGSGAEANIEVNGGLVTNVTITQSGTLYQNNDVLSANPIFDGVGSGTNFEYTLTSIVNTGVVTNITITDDGQNYVSGDILSVNDSDVGSGNGSGFQFIVTSNPGIISNFLFTDRGSGYQTGDILSIVGGVDGVATNLKSIVSNVSTNLTSGDATIIVSDTSGILEGMLVSLFGESNIGNLQEGTTVQSIDSSTQITLSAAAIATGSATLRFSSPGNIREIVVSSVSGIGLGDSISQVSGTGILGSGVTVSSIDSNTNTIILSQDPIQAGTAVLDFLPPYGNPTIDFEYEIGDLGVVDSISIFSGGNGYTNSDILTVDPTLLVQPIVWPVINRSLDIITFDPSPSDNTFSVGDVVRLVDGSIVSFSQTAVPTVSQVVSGPFATTLSTGSAQITISDTSGITQGDFASVDQTDIGQLSENTTVLSVDSPTTLTLSANPISSGSASITFRSNESGTYTNISSTSSGSGIGAVFDVVRSIDGSIASIQIGNNSGIFYQSQDTITISGSLIGGSSPTHDIVLEVSTTLSSQDQIVRKVVTSNGNTDKIYVDFANPINNGDEVYIVGQEPVTFSVDTSSGIAYRWFINTGSGYEFTPNLTMYSGSTYSFDLSDSSNASHQFILSQFRDGIHPPSNITGLSAILNTNSKDITVSSAIGLIVGMSVFVSSGSGTLEPDTVIENISGNTITLSSFPTSDGFAALLFTGTEYTDGVTRTGNTLTISVNENTPNLYYSCSINSNNHYDEGGEDNSEALITIDTNNPKVFGSDLTIQADDVQSSDVISGDITTGEFSALSISSPSGSFSNINSNGTASLASVIANSLQVQSITGGSISVTTNSGITFNSDLRVGSSNAVTVSRNTGNIDTIGRIKTLSSINVNDILTIDDNVISTTSNLDLILTPPTSRVAKINSVTALTIPSGSTSQRPSGSAVSNGSIRFNTETGQYEGYSAANLSWSSLGGVRDLDGNTTILAEESIGVNDNTLWFINDNINTVRFTPTHLEFVGQKSIRSANINAPSYVDWTANTPVQQGVYLKYRNNLYEVTVGGVTAGSGNAPVHTSGALVNGTAELTWYSLAVAPLTFEDIEVLKIGPFGNLPVSINNDLRLADNVISTDINDLVIRPNSGKKVIIDAPSTLVIPTGADTDRGIPSQGSIRFSTTSSQFEGFDGNNWGSLGGVKDVDQNTYIIPELAPGTNENILYFYNDNSNTLQLTTTSLDFYSVDTIRSVTSDELEITASLLTFDGGASVLDNTEIDRTFFNTAKRYFDIGLSAGLTVDPVLRLDDQGDVYLNTGFGTGVYNGVKVFDGDLKEFELSDIRILTEKLTLVKGTSDNSSSVIYNIATNSGAKTTVIAENLVSGDKEYIEFGILDNGNDVFHTEYGNIRTGVQLIIPTFEVTGANNVRINISLGDNVNLTESVNITVVSNITKK